MMLRKPTCADCPHNLQYMERLPIKKKGVTMHLGERFCVAGKRARKFKRSDPKTYVPSWCPRLKAPCEDLWLQESERMEDAPQYVRVSGRGYFSICIPLCGAL